MTRVHLDIETFSAVDLRKTNVYRYSTDPSFRILMLAWSFDGKPTMVITNEEAIWFAIIDLLRDPDVTLVAHNAMFERVCFGQLLGYNLNPARFDCTAARAAEYGYPTSLDGLAKALRCTPKDTAGTRLINLFCKPNRSGGRNDADSHPAEWLEFKSYCAQDVDTLREVDAVLPGWPTPVERAAWEADQHVNDRGVLVDLALAAAAAAAAEANKAVQKAEVTALTEVVNPASQPQLLSWFDGLLPDLTKETVRLALDEPGLLDGTQRRVLELRQDLALSASSKYTAALANVCPDGRLRGSMRFYGAHTGRWTGGAGVQPHNLPRMSPDEAALVDLQLGLGADPQALKSLVRSMFLGPFTVVDFSQIEARVLAWLAGESWILEAFRNGDDIYVETAERLGGLTRQQGKTTVLACGYAGGVGALKRMAGDRVAQCRVAGVEPDVSDAELDEGLEVIKTAWRDANPRTVAMWRSLTDAIDDGGQVGRVRLRRRGGVLQMRLPSGRSLYYHGLTFGSYTVAAPTLEEPDRRVQKNGWRYLNSKSPGRLPLYGGIITNNLVQGVARDLLAAALIRLEERGFPVVLHCHDEVLVEGEHDLEEIIKLVCEGPGWASGLPIDAEGFQCQRYRKG